MTILSDLHFIVELKRAQELVAVAGNVSARRLQCVQIAFEHRAVGSLRFGRRKHMREIDVVLAE